MGLKLGAREKEQDEKEGRDKKERGRRNYKQQQGWREKWEETRTR